MHAPASHLLPQNAGEPAAGGVIPSLSFEALLARRAAAVERLTAIATAVHEYQELGAAIFDTANDGETRYLSAPYKFREPLELRPSGHGEYLTSRDWLTAAIASVDAALWDHLLEKSGLRSFMDATARKDWDDQIEKRQTPALTPENVRSTFQALHARRGEFFDRGVIAVFRSLCWDYKTNRPHKFGKRVVIRHLLSQWGGPAGRASDGLDDLLRVFHVLDGKPEPDHRSSIGSRLWDLHRDGTREIVTSYVRIRTFKNGNGHVTFTRPDLVDQLNRILAKHYPDALPPAENER